MMANAAIKVALESFNIGKQVDAPPELQEYWNELNERQWQDHLELFTKELRKHKDLKIKEILYDLGNYIKDCKKLESSFSKTKEEILLLTAIGQINAEEFVQTFNHLPTNKEKLDRKLEKQLKLLEWEDEKDLDKLDELTQKLANPKIKKSDIEGVDKAIDTIEKNITRRRSLREELALKLVEWKARGNIDIADSEKGKFRLDA